MNRPPSWTNPLIGGSQTMSHNEYGSGNLLSRLGILALRVVAEALFLSVLLFQHRGLNKPKNPIHS